MTGVLWCPLAVQAPVSGHTTGGGAFTGGAPKIVHHSTEGHSAASAFGAYRASGYLPHFTDSYEAGVYAVWQHLPLDVAATALEHPKFSGDTNRDSAIQIEHVGDAATSSHWADGYLDGIGRLCRWIEAQTGCRPETNVRFAAGAPRLTWAEWHAYNGHLGHMHVPFNHHTDPGPFNITRILGAQPAGDYYPKGDDVPKPTDKVRRIPNPTGTGGWQLQADGGVFAYDGAPGFPPRYAVLGSDGSVFHFPYGDPAKGLVWSYPGLPAEARQGTRYFTDIWAE